MPRDNAVIILHKITLVKGKKLLYNGRAMLSWCCRKILLSLLLAMLLLPLASSRARAQSAWDKACVGSGTGADVATIQGVTCLLRNILNVVLTILGFIGFVMLVYASFNLLISGGQPSHLETTKGTFTYVIIGLFLAVGSFAIMKVVDSLVNKASGSTIMELKFPGNTVENKPQPKP